MQKNPAKFSQKHFLISLILQAIEQAERRWRRVPTKEEILDELFTASRDDPEARALERKLDLLLTSLIEDLEAVKAWADEC